MEQNVLSNMILDKESMILEGQPKWTFGKNTCNTYEVFVSHFRNAEGHLLPSWPILQVIEQDDALSQLFSITLLWEAVRHTVEIGQRADSNVTLSINLLPRFAENDHFVSQVRRCLEETGLPGKKLQLEVSELQKLSPQGCANLNMLHDELGVLLVMGNFGTASTNMPLLYQVHFDLLELHRSYSERMLEDESVYRAIVGIQHMADTLGIQMCAKGVDTQAQFEAYEEIGFYKCQGSLIAPPMSMQELEEYVKRYALTRGHK